MALKESTWKGIHHLENDGGVPEKL